MVAPTPTIPPPPLATRLTLRWQDSGVNVNTELPLLKLVKSYVISQKSVLQGFSAAVGIGMEVSATAAAMVGIAFNTGVDTVSIINNANLLGTASSVPGSIPNNQLLQIYFTDGLLLESGSRLEIWAASENVATYFDVSATFHLTVV